MYVTFLSQKLSENRRKWPGLDWCHLLYAELLAKLLELGHPYVAAARGVAPWWVWQVHGPVVAPHEELLQPQTLRHLPTNFTQGSQQSQDSHKSQQSQTGQVGITGVLDITEQGLVCPVL